MEGESLGARQFQSGQYTEALNTFTACLGRLQSNENTSALRIKLHFNCSACHLKLKQFAKVVEQCEKILALEPLNSKALGRKVKALCSLGQFSQALDISNKWLQDDPNNTQARQEVERLDIVVKALNAQEGDDDGLEMVCERVPPDGQESNSSTVSPSISVTASLPSASNLKTTASSTITTTTTAAGTHITSNPSSQASVPGVDIKNESKQASDSPRPSYSSKVKGSKGSQNKVGSGRLKPPSPRTVNSHQPQATQEVKTAINKHPKPAKITIVNSNGNSVSDNDKDKDSEKNKDGTGSDDKIWKYRPAPRGLTAQEYTKCPRYNEGNTACSLGKQCTFAHSDEELVEWKERFEMRCKSLVKARDSDKSSYAYKLLEKWMTAKNPQDVMTEILEGVNIHCNTSLSAVITSKQSSHTWLFTITSKMCLMRVALVSEESRDRFTLAAITMGPKRGQEKQPLEDKCTEWLNTNYVAGKSPNDKVCRVTVQFQTTIYGTFRQWLVLDFGLEPVLCRQMVVESSPLTDLHQLQKDLMLSEQNRWDLSTITTVPFTPRSHTLDTQDEELLAKYPAPMATKFKASESILEPCLTLENYRMRMHHLLYIEEMAQFSSIAKFNVHTSLQLVDRFLLMPSWGSTAKYAHDGELFARMTLSEVLSEDTTHGRLILQNITSVYIAPHKHKASSQQPEKVYETVVEEKGKRFLFFRLSATCVNELRLRKDTSPDFQVQFQLNRMPLCEMHLAVDLLPNVDMVFPNVVEKPTIPWSPVVHWSHQFDSKLNPKQREAVVAMTADLSLNLHPILLVGPYGTGKTYTLAQATLEILKKENSRVLICTHSNSAADLYIQDYLHPYLEDGNPEARPLRIFYQYRWLQTVSPTVRQYALINMDDTNQSYQFRKPKREDLDSHRVVVTTLGTSRYLHNLDLPTDYFTHILLDEAAQAMECEIILPLTLAGPHTRVVLAGDHMQLSPEVHSCFARDRNLHMSLLERLYELYPSDNHCRILLCENYRSHKAIIDFTSELFYNNKLVASGNQKKHPMFYPLTFFTAQGEDEQHQNSTNFCNNAEVYEIVERVEELQKQWPKTWGTLNDSSIGVVAPYSDQVQRIRAELRKKKMFRVSVERVLNVQGKQFRVIFLSTVRTRATCNRDPGMEEFLDYGFLSNVKLLNTAITRAQSLVAVVGDPVSLCSVGKCRKIWERFVDICNKNDSLYGITYTNLRSLLDGVEIKKSYVLNPLAPEFVPNRLRHCSYTPPEPIAVGKYGYTFTCGPAATQGQPTYTTPTFASMSTPRMTPSMSWTMPPAQQPRFTVANPQMLNLYQMMGLYPMMHPPYAASVTRAQRPAFPVSKSQSHSPVQLPIPPTSQQTPLHHSPGGPQRKQVSPGDKSRDFTSSLYEGMPLMPPPNMMAPMTYMTPMTPVTPFTAPQGQFMPVPYNNRNMGCLGNPLMLPLTRPEPPPVITRLPAPSHVAGTLHVETNTEKNKSSSGSSTPTFRFLPTACNVKSPSLSPRSAATSRQVASQQHKADDARSALFQLELLSYMQQTEGSKVTDSYYASLTSPVTGPSMTLPVANNIQNSSVQDGNLGQGSSSAPGVSINKLTQDSIHLIKTSTWSAPCVMVGSDNQEGENLPSLVPVSGLVKPGMALKEGTYFCSDLEQEMGMNPDENSPASAAGSDAEPAMDTLSNMMSFLDEGVDDKGAPGQKLKEKIAKSPPPPSTLLMAPASGLGDGKPDRPVPLYLRGSFTVTQNANSTTATTSMAVVKSPVDVLSYATALQSSTQSDGPAPFPVSPSQIPPATPITPCVDSLLSNPFFPSSKEADMPEESLEENSEKDETDDPLEVLRNLKIKPSPATEALYQYFA